MLLIIGWQTYNISRDAGMTIAAASGQLALIGLLQFLPLFILTPFSGLAADYFDRRKLSALMIVLQLLCSVALCWSTWNDSTTLTTLFVIAVVLGVARCFAGPALSALAPNLVPTNILPTAIALSSISWQFGMIGGPAIGGLLFKIYPALPYAAASLLFLISAISTVLITKVAQPKSNAQQPISAIIEGASYVLKNKMVLGAITLDLFAVFLAGATALLPVYARDILMVGEVGLASLAAAPAAGAAITALYFSFKPLRTNVGPKMLWAVAVFGGATIAFGLSTNLALSLSMLFIIGVADMFSVYIRQSLIQLHTPDDKRGRVSSVSLLTISASNEGGDAFSGTLAFAVGPVAAVVAGGLGAIITVLLWSRFFPVLRKTRTFDIPVNISKQEK
jgi:MFS family permease